MTIKTEDFTHYAGDTLVLGVTTKNPDGSVVDLTNSEIEWVLAESVSDTPVVSKGTSGGGIAVTDAEGGRFEILLDPVDTELLSGSYYHEAEFRDSGGNESTILVGTVTIKETAL
jgi:hypothetical protein